jgi:hypothetical protein
MKPAAGISLAFLAAAIGFGVGYYLNVGMSDREREDLAFQGVLENLAQLHFLERHDETEALKLTNISLDKYLQRMNEYEGHNSDPRWLAARARTLNAVALRWEGRDLVKDLGLEGEIADDWSEGHARNLAMLRRAQETCRAHPEYNCKTAISPPP